MIRPLAEVSSSPRNLQMRCEQIEICGNRLMDTVWPDTRSSSVYNIAQHLCRYSTVLLSAMFVTTWWAEVEVEVSNVVCGLCWQCICYVCCLWSRTAATVPYRRLPRTSTSLTCPCSPSSDRQPSPAGPWRWQLPSHASIRRNLSQSAAARMSRHCL